MGNEKFLADDGKNAGVVCGYDRRVNPGGIIAGSELIGNFLGMK